MTMACPCLLRKDCITALKREVRKFESVSTACLLRELNKEDNSTEQEIEGNITTSGIRAPQTVGVSTAVTMSADEFDQEVAYKELL
ncbi:hypothetical protein ANCCAN_12019 [Ancylostoma caninum]|uniref:Uncharacterized protein n=1 Tax=Ancylostoma caninum TaxID=29170 RepID=A0A368GEE9_ANCCA|nr:hypothetical protein ANCCAN_12019 [Ancylostoma caninum]